MNNAQKTYLDLLRGFAAQLVLLGHIYSMVLFPGETLGLGDLGVIIFFILSGFLISYTSLSKVSRGNYSFSAYLTDRFFRIFVPYIPAVVLILLLDSYVYNYTNNRVYFEHYGIKDLLATLGMLQQHPVGLFFDKLLGISQVKLSTFGSARPLWTVAIEWWLYVVFGLALFFSWNSRHWLILLVAFLVSAIVPLFNSVAGTGQGLSLLWILMACLAYFYLQSGEMVQERLSEYLRNSYRHRFLFVLFLGILFLLMTTRFFWISYIEPGFVFERPIFYDFNLYVLIAIILITVFIALGSVQTEERCRSVMFVADYSYSLYLIHYTLIFFLLSVGFSLEGKMENLLLYYVLCNFVAVAFWWVFERNHYRVKSAFMNMFGRKYRQGR